MQIQVRSNHIEGSVGLHEWVSAAVEDRLERFDDLLTRVEVHVGDENAQKAGAADKRCQIEVRPKGYRSRIRPSRWSWRWTVQPRKCTTPLAT
jgi:ribosome-associated translation inhibitor RaiA